MKLFRQQWVSETGETAGSAETVSVVLNDTSIVSLSEEEARQLAAVLTFQADRIAAARTGARR